MTVIKKKAPRGAPFQKGHAGGPGRPVGNRNKLSEKFIQALYQDFEDNGMNAIRLCRLTDPATYCRIIASLVPKELKLDVRETMSDAEISQQLQKFLAADLENPIDGKTIEGEFVEQ